MISYEAWIESKAGAIPTVTRYCNGRSAHIAHWWRDSEHVYRWCAGRDWPQPEPPPFEADDEGRIEP